MGGHVRFDSDTIGLLIMAAVCVLVMVSCYLLGFRDKVASLQWAMGENGATAGPPVAAVNGYAQIEVMGHQYREGEVREVTMGGRRMLEIAVEYDSPYGGEAVDPPRVEYLSPDAVFRITPRDPDECADERADDRRRASGEAVPPSGERSTPTDVSRVHVVTKPPKEDGWSARSGGEAHAATWP